MKVSSIRWGVIWIGIGIFFLAINFQVLDVLVFPRLFSLWPILLIALGVELIFRKTKLYFIALVSPIVFAAAFVVAAVNSNDSSWGFKEFFGDWSWKYKSDQHFSEEFPINPDIKNMILNLEFGHSDFEIVPSEQSMFSVKSWYNKKSPMLSYDYHNDTMNVNFVSREKNRISILKFGNASKLTEISFSNNLPLSINLRTEFENPEIDFSEFSLSDVRLNLKAKQTVVYLENKSDFTKIIIEGETDSLKFKYPSDVGIEIDGNGINFDQIVDDSFIQKDDNKLYSENFDRSSKKISIVIEGKVNQIEFERVNTQIY